MAARYVVGIDLGTTNSVVAYALLEGESPQVELLPIPQLVAADTVESRGSLPSFLYIGTPEESHSFKLPWHAGRTLAAGELARRQSAEVPQRSVVGAKSWLANSRVDRHQPILPWNAPADVDKISPVDASREYLAHLAAAWNSAMPDARLAEQQVVLTVPASFDAAARDLTREAATAAGLPHDFLLLEEPQAAVYAWLAQTGDRWRRLLNVGDALLVCDVGGGTTDLTLVRVGQEHGELVLERAAVGNHLLVGGDNMDLALAHYVAQKFSEQGVKLDPWQSISLWHSCRQAKESLLAAEGPASHTIAIAGRGSKLIKGSVKTDVAREAATTLLVDGFFPACSVSDRPARRRQSGFQEIGLPFESDTAITKHVAAFLSAHGESPETPVRPTHVLFNGGVFKSQALRSRLLDVVSGWFAGAGSPVPLEGKHDLENAVARGAAYYGWTKHHGGMRIRGGTARSYYVGIETAGLAVPGAPRPLKALCVVPLGMEEGTEANIPSGEIGLVVGEPAQFRFFSSAVRKDDKPGDLVDYWSEEEIVETDSLEATLSAVEGIDEPYVPVQFQSRITELGVFELWCVNRALGGRWKLEFSVREDHE
jgi:hypothetical protein